MASSKSKTGTIRLPNEMWEKMDWIAINHGERRNDFIRAAIAERLKRYQIPDLNVIEGQQELFS